MKKISAFVFAAGLGSRLYPLTANRPKALVRYQGRPLLEHVLDKIIGAGISDIVVNVHHFPDQIINYIHSRPFDADIRISDERAYLRDTAGGLKFAEPILQDSDAVLLYNVDIISSIDLRKMLEYHDKHGGAATLAVRKRNTSRYLVFDEPTLRLCGWKNVRSGETLSSQETNSPVELAFSGIHVVERDLIRRISTVEKQSLTPFYLQVANDFNILGYDHTADEWMDVGKYAEFRNILE